MRTLKVIILAGLIGLATTFTGCGGGGSKVQSETITTTLGQELMDFDSHHVSLLKTHEEDPLGDGRVGVRGEAEAR